MKRTQKIRLDGGSGELDQLVDRLLTTSRGSPGFPQAQVDACLQGDKDDGVFKAEAPGALVGSFQPGEQSACCSTYSEAFYLVAAKGLGVNCIESSDDFLCLRRHAHSRIRV